MRPKTLLALFLLVAGLGAFIWFYERDLPGSDQRAQLQKRVLTVESPDVLELVIERDGATVHLSRPPAGEADPEIDDPAAVERQWRLLEPHDARADNSSVNRLAESLATLEKERTLEDVDPAVVGLQSPRATVTVRTAGTEAVLRVGAEIPASSKMVVATDEGTFAVADSVWSQLETAPGDWRSKELFPLHRGAVEKVELTTPEGTMRLARRDETFWLEEPVEDLAEAARVEDLLDSIYRVEVAAFHDRPELPPEEMGLAPAGWRLAVTLTGRDQPVVLELGTAVPDEAEQRFARIDGQVVSIGDDLDELIDGSASDWQATSWTALEVYEIDSFRVVDAEGELVLERAGADWTRDGVEIAYSPVSDFLYALTGAAGEQVLERREANQLGADLSEPALELSLKGSSVEENLSLHEGRDGIALAAREGRAYLLSLSAGTVEDLRLKLQAIRAEPELGAGGDEEEG